MLYSTNKHSVFMSLQAVHSNAVQYKQAFGVYVSAGCAQQCCTVQTSIQCLCLCRLCTAMLYSTNKHSVFMSLQAAVFTMSDVPCQHELICRAGKSITQIQQWRPHVTVGGLKLPNILMTSATSLLSGTKK